MGPTGKMPVPRRLCLGAWPGAIGVGGGWAETLLRWVKRKRLEVPAAMLLEMHRPLMPLAWSAAMVCGGLLARLGGDGDERDGGGEPDDAGGRDERRA